MKTNLKIVKQNNDLTKRKCIRILNKIEKILIEHKMQISIKDNKLVLRKDNKIFEIEDIGSNESIDYFPTLLFYNLREI